MFGLVLLSVTVIAFLVAEQNAALDTVVKQDSGGYDVLTQTTRAVPDLAARIGADGNLNGKGAAVIAFNNTELSFVKDLTSGGGFAHQFAVGGDPNAPPQRNF